MTKNQALEAIQRRIENLIEKEIDEKQSDWNVGWDHGYKTACEQILYTIKLYKKF